MKQPKITDYLDYRAYLSDYFAFRKSTSAKFSHRQFAARLKLSSPSFISEVIKGKKKLSQKLVLALAGVLQFGDRENRYFDLLTKFNQAKSMEEKNHFFLQLAKFRNSRARVVHESHYKFYTKWYYSAVWAWLGIKKNADSANPVKIAAEIYPSITKSQAGEAIELLLDLQLIQKTANGYKVTDKHLVTENPFRGMVAGQYHQMFIDMAKNALTGVKADARQYNTLMFTVSEKGVQNIKERIRVFQEELRELIERDEKEDRVYSLNMQLFPNTKKH